MRTTGSQTRSMSNVSESAADAQAAASEIGQRAFLSPLSVGGNSDPISKGRDNRTELSGTAHLGESRRGVVPRRTGSIGKDEEGIVGTFALRIHTRSDKL